MPPKSSGKPTKQSRKPIDVKPTAGPVINEERKGPCAVILANLESSRFAPLTNHMAHCLLPLCNVPLLHYTLTRLIVDGFQDILIYACSHFAQLREFVHNMVCYGDVRITVHNGEGSHSLGDMMRNLDQSETLRGVADFLLVPADLICAVPLLPLLQQHQARRSSNSNAILSLILPSISPHISRSQAAEWGVTALFSHSNDRLTRLSYALDEPTPLVPLSDLARADPCSELASDLMDLGLAVCSSHVPPLFQDNFDYRNMGDLVHDVLTNEEIMGYSIHVNTVPLGPTVLRAAPDLSSLIHFSPVLLARVGGTNVSLLPASLLPHDHKYLCLGPQVYVAHSAKVHPKARLFGTCLIGPGCDIGAHACLVDCVFGSDCKVGDKARLRHVVALNEVTIGSHVRADVAWICARARLLTGLRLPRACFVGPSEDAVITLGPGRGALPAKCVIVAPTTTDLVIEPSVGGSQVWATLHIQKTRFDPNPSARMARDSRSSESESDWDDPFTDDTDVCHLWDTAEDRLRLAVRNRHRNRSRALSSTSDARRLSKSFSKRSRATDSDIEEEEDMSGGSTDEGEQSEAFLIQELRHTLEHCQLGTESADNVTLEVNSLKHAYNIPIDDLYFLLMKAVFDLTRSAAPAIQDTDEKSQIRSFMSELNKQLCRFHTLLKSYLTGSDSDGRICLQALEDTACYHHIVMLASPFIAHALYDKDLVTEPAIWWWLEHSPLLSDNDLTDQTRLMRQKLQPFLTWLREAEEDTSETNTD